VARLVGIAVSLLALGLWGCGGGNGGPPRDTDPPAVTAGSLTLVGTTQTGTRLELAFVGGRVVVRATVTDPSGVALVRLLVTPAPPTFTPQDLTPDAQGKVESAPVELPANLESTDKTYEFRLRVRDTLGNEGERIVGTVVVKAASGLSPPPPPF